jgi:hypothetical protein
MTYYQANSNDVFLDAIDASYCAVFEAPGAQCGTIPAADVWSTSWSFGTDVISALKIRQCNEFVFPHILNAIHANIRQDI